MSGHAVMFKDFKEQGAVALVPEILNVTPISLERSNNPKWSLNGDASVFLAFYFKSKTDKKNDKDKDKDKEKEKEKRKVRTPARTRPWNFFDAGMYTLDLPEAGGDDMFCAELWSSGLIKSVLEGSLEVSLDFLKTMVSGECECEKDFWLKLRSPNAAATTVADLRISVSLGRKDTTIVKHIRDAIAVRLLEGTRGAARTTQLCPRTLSSSMLLQARATPGKAVVLERAVAEWAATDDSPEFPRKSGSAKKKQITRGRSASIGKRSDKQADVADSADAAPAKKSHSRISLSWKLDSGKLDSGGSRKSASKPLLLTVGGEEGWRRRVSANAASMEQDINLGPSRMSEGDLTGDIQALFLPLVEPPSRKLPSPATPLGQPDNQSEPVLTTSTEDSGHSSPLILSPECSPRYRSSPGSPRTEALRALAKDQSSPFQRACARESIPELMLEEIVEGQREELKRRGSIPSKKVYGGYGSYGVAQVAGSVMSRTGEQVEDGYGMVASSATGPSISSDDDDESVSVDGSKKKAKVKVIKWESDLIFNESWQHTVERMIAEDGSTTSDTHERLSDLSRKFVAVAKSYGSMIVRELHLPLERKTVKPIDVGGVIGGTKFVVAGVLFKVALGSELLPSESSAKIAGHELKALTALFNVTSIHHIPIALPMIAILDVLGHRLIALALCPIAATTLVHGSANAGDTIVSKEEAVERLSLVASHLNLKVHTIRGHQIPLALDCEVHCAPDERMYVIDLSRVLPPELPDRTRGGPLGHLFRLLRPELVQGNATPLSSDACSAFIANEEDALEQAREVSDATKRLYKEVIPLAALALDQLHMARSDPDWTFYRLDHMHRILHVVHASGVNMRFLLRVMFQSGTRVSQQLLLVECCSRTVKQELRALMRKALDSAQESPGGVHDVLVTRKIVEYWNLLLSKRQAASLELWNTVAAAMQNYFGWLDPVKPLGGEQLCEQLLQVPLGMCLMFLRVNEQLGFQWSSRVTGLIESSFKWLEAQQEVRDEDLGEKRRTEGSLHEKFAGFLQRSKTSDARRVSVGFSAPPIVFQESASTSGLKKQGTSSALPSAGPSSREEEETVRRAKELDEERRRLQKRLLEISNQQQQLERQSAKDPLSTHPLQNLSPWAFWIQQAAQLFFEDDLVDVGSRVKLNNQAAMAMGSKLMGLADTADQSLKQHFRLLASRMFDMALMSNPTSPVTLRHQAHILLSQEAHRVGVEDPRVPNSMAPYFWSSTLRYIEFLYRVALSNDMHDSRCLCDYAIFLASGGQSRYQSCWYLVRAVCADHDNLEAVNFLVSALESLGMHKESTILAVWHNGKSSLKPVKRSLEVSAQAL